MVIIFRFAKSENGFDRFNNFIYIYPLSACSHVLIY